MATVARGKIYRQGQFEALLEKFHAKRNGDGWMARCPAHDDRNPSLSISCSGNKILLHCHAGCSVDHVCAASGVEAADLFLDGADTVNPRLVATYRYVDEQNALLFEVCRYEPKAFKQRRPDGKGGWVWNARGVRRVLYNLPAVLQADKVFVVEGERDVDTATKLGVVATTNCGGAGKWKGEFSEFLRDKRCVIIADADEPGRKHARQIAMSLLLKAASTKIIEMPVPGAKDLTEAVERGFTGKLLTAFAADAPTWSPDVEPAKGEDSQYLFHTLEEFQTAPSLRFLVDGFLQADSATIFGGLPGHGKTLLLLSVCRALLKGEGTMLWGQFRVCETAEKLCYLIPESTIGPFGHRLKLFGLMKYVEQKRLLVRTLSKGFRVELDDPRILAAARGAHVVLDTMGRWSEGDENNANDNQRGLASDIFGLLGAGATSVQAAHHAPKSFARENMMSLESCLRGSGDIGAMVSTAYGLRQIDREANVIFVESIKSRDFTPPPAFMLAGRPHIDESGDFAMHRKPGECQKLQQELPQPERDRGGAPVLVRESKAANMELVRLLLTTEPALSSSQIAQRLAVHKVKLDDSTIRKYRKELGL